LLLAAASSKRKNAITDLHFTAVGHKLCRSPRQSANSIRRIEVAVDCKLAITDRRQPALTGKRYFLILSELKKMRN
jgi:hypothetical protein